jgi:hypothetical protein
MERSQLDAPDRGQTGREPLRDHSGDPLLIAKEMIRTGHLLENGLRELGAAIQDRIRLGRCLGIHEVERQLCSDAAAVAGRGGDNPRGGLHVRGLAPERPESHGAHCGAIPGSVARSWLKTQSRVTA